MSQTIGYYDSNADALAQQYESLSFEQVHSSILDLIPSNPGLALDVGAGSGRDAAWLANSGWDVVALEPADGLRQLAQRLHPEPSIRWLDDRLPGLENVYALNLTFDFVLVSAVWMHIKPDERKRAFRKLVNLMNPGAVLVISLRCGPMNDGRQAYSVSTQELEQLAVQHGVSVAKIVKSDDLRGREGVAWQTVCLRIPNDGTGALPLLRHTILVENKSSTYKLALLRVLVRIADSASGMVREAGDEVVSLPLGLVALYWLRMYKPLLDAGLPQAPMNRGGKGLGFVKESFNALSVSPFELRIGGRFAGQTAEWLRGALIDARDTIVKMPAFYIKYPNTSEQIFKTARAGKVSSGLQVDLTEEYLRSFGEMLVPRHIWICMSRFASWIEPALINEWVRLMQSYLESFNRQESLDMLLNKLTWIEPGRDTARARAIALRLLSANEPVHCVWSGKKLSADNIDIDHCFPFAAWPCGDLWNLFPSHPLVNQHQKRDKLVSREMFLRARDLMHTWWHDAYVANEIQREQFVAEASSSLPGVKVDSSDTDLSVIFDGILLKRAALKRDLQLPEWELK